MIDRGANVNSIENTHGFSPLIIAVNNNFPNIVKFLMEKGADPNIKDKKGETAIVWAKKRGQKNMIEILSTKYSPKIKSLH